MQKFDEAEKELASHTHVLSLLEDTFTMEDCIIAIVLNCLQFLGHGDYMSPKARRELSAWWRRVKIRESLIGSANEPNIPKYMLRAKLVLSRMLITEFIIVTKYIRVHSCLICIYLQIEIKSL